MAIAAIWPFATDIVIDNAYGGMAIAIRISAGGAGIRHKGGVVAMPMANPAIPAGVGTAGIHWSYNA